MPTDATAAEQLRPTTEEKRTVRRRKNETSTEVQLLPCSSCRARSLAVRHRLRLSPFISLALPISHSQGVVHLLNTFDNMGTWWLPIPASCLNTPARRALSLSKAFAAFLLSQESHIPFGDKKREKVESETCQLLTSRRESTCCCSRSALLSSKKILKIGFQGRREVRKLVY